VLARRHQVRLISIGNGTASRETDRLAADLIRQHPELHLVKVVVSEAGQGRRFRGRRLGLFGLGIRLPGIPGT